MREFWLLMAVGIFGSLGAVSRWGISRWVNHIWGSTSPVGTFLANVLGCFLMGILLALSSHPRFPPAYRAAIGVGFLGSLTTFSTFSADTLHLLNSGRGLAAMGNVAANLILGLLAVAIGIWLANFFIGSSPHNLDAP